MQQVDIFQLIPKASAIIDRLVHFFGSSRFSTPQPYPAMTNIEWPDSDFKQPYCESDHQPVSGGYNEAYIVQYWASYHLK